MTVLSKFKLLRMLSWEILKGHAHWKSAILAAWVGTGSVMLVRGIRRDRQSSTAAATDKLLQEAIEKSDKRRSDGPPSRSFSQRFRVILNIICPGWKTKETWFLGFLSVLLVGMYNINRGSPHPQD